MTPEERRAAIERELRQMDKPHISIARPRVCQSCGAVQGRDENTYAFVFKGRMNVSTSFQDICRAAKWAMEYMK